MVEQDLGAAQLSVRIGFLSPARLSATLDGERAMAGREVASIADALGVSATWLVTGRTEVNRTLRVIACAMPSDEPCDPTEPGRQS